MSAGLLFDASRCIGCQACAVACKEQNGLPEEIESRLTAYTWTTVEAKGDVFVRRLCFHCLDPTCVSVCPVGALKRTPEGAVVYDKDRCIGCRYCMMACPFDVPKYQWDRAVPVVGKCTLCISRLRKGEPTACAAACPAEATVFGDRDALAREARSRIEGEPQKYVDHVYGLEEAGGTGVMTVSGVPFETLGLPAHVPRQPLPLFTWQVLSKVPDFVTVAGAFLYGVHWITRRREDVQAEQAAAAAAAAQPPARTTSSFFSRIFGRRRRS